MKTLIILTSLYFSFSAMANFDAKYKVMSSEELNTYRCAIKSKPGTMVVRSARDIKAADLKTATAIGHYMITSNPNHLGVEVFCELK
jgi:hypothetical protein